MAISNRERVTKGLELLRAGLLPFVEQELKEHLGGYWFEEVSSKVQHGLSRAKDGSIHWDTGALLKAMADHWQSAFKQTLGHAERALVGELLTVRNRWAHDDPFSSDDAYRALDSMSRLLTAVSSGEHATEVDKHKQDLLRVVYSEQARNKTRYAPIAGSPKAGLSGWRDLIDPHEDVRTGQLEQAEFAANLAEVHEGKGSDEYKDPIQFFRRTFLTEGLRALLVGALQRLSGKGGNPALQLQTNFGGGKTHSMLALYHLFGRTPSGQLPGIETVLAEAEVKSAPAAKRAVLVGTHLSPGHVTRKPDGTEVHTLWGEMAWQIAGKEGYALVADDDRRGVSPGAKVLSELFHANAPCIVLIDEWVAYARQLVGKQNLPGGSFEAQATFAQSLTEAAKTDKTLVVASIPASNDPRRTSSDRTAVEVGGEYGMQVLHTLEEVFKRIATPWHPATPEEGFEIVRRRLFEPIDAANAAARDAVLDAFSKMYRDAAGDFPQGCSEGAYRRKMEAAYPIHPELFDKLFGDWSSLEKFQKTRGVLRFLAKVVHRLWEGQDANLLIMPSTVPLDDRAVYGELRNYLEEPWEAIVASEVDGPDSLPAQVERTTTNLGRYSACRRVTRTVFMGTAPGAAGRNPGVDDREVKLGCSQPGESTATFGDALRRLTDRATYLYVDGSRYWFSTHPTVTRIAEDRARSLEEEEAVDEVLRRLRQLPKVDAFPGGVHVAPASGDVPDEPAARLVILDPRAPHVRGQKGTPAQVAATEILTNRGSAPRLNRNMVVFLAADRQRVEDLYQAAKQYLAWKSIVEDEAKLELTTSQRNQAKKRRDDADSTVDIKVREAWTWILAPYQPSPTAEIELEEDRGNGGDALVPRTAAKLVKAGKLLPAFGANVLRDALDTYLWTDRDHVTFGQLFEYFCRYVYLPRLVGRETLVAAVQDGASRLEIEETFAVADAWDDARKRYRGLRRGGSRIVQVTNDTLIVKPDVAARQDGAESGTFPIPGPDGGSSPAPGGGGGRRPDAPDPGPTKPTLFVASASLNPLRIGRDAGRVAEEVVQHLTSLAGADATVTLEIQVRVPDGVDESVVRTVTENCRTLGFKSHEFEED
jgi:hypothetical protein